MGLMALVVLRRCREEGDLNVAGYLWMYDLVGDGVFRR